MQKTNKSIAKRFKVTASGKVLRRTGGFRHFLRSKTVKQRRSARHDKSVSAGFSKQVLRAIAVSL
jgi:large subunit ribosomal protein L35